MRTIFDIRRDLYEAVSCLRDVGVSGSQNGKRCVDWHLDAGYDHERGYFLSVVLRRRLIAVGMFVVFARTEVSMANGMVNVFLDSRVMSLDV